MQKSLYLNIGKGFVSFRKCLGTDNLLLHLPQISGSKKNIFGLNLMAEKHDFYDFKLKNFDYEPVKN